jgi:beta-glucosidase
MAAEYLKKSINMILGPVVGPVGRVVAGGRNWEGFSVDPYLAGALVYNTVAAVHAEGIITSTKVRHPD